MRIRIKARDMILIAPGEEYDVPGDIGKQLIERSHAEVVEEKKDKKGKQAL
jgi:hypothetical protein